MLWKTFGQGGADRARMHHHIRHTQPDMRVHPLRAMIMACPVMMVVVALGHRSQLHPGSSIDDGQVRITAPQLWQQRRLHRRPNPEQQRRLRQRRHPLRIQNIRLRTRPRRRQRLYLNQVTTNTPDALQLRRHADQHPQWRC